MCLGVPGRVVDVFERDGVRMASVDFGETAREACLTLQPGADVGSYVVVHSGFAVSIVDETEAKRSYALLAEMEGVGERPASGGSATARRSEVRATPIRR